MIQVLDLFNNVIGEIPIYTGLALEYHMDSWVELSFTAPSTPNNNRLLQNEVRVSIQGLPGVIKGVNPSRGSDGTPAIAVSVHSIASDLNYKPRQVVGTYIGAETYSNWESLHNYTAGDRIKYYGIVYECVTTHVSGSDLSGGQWIFWTTCKFQQELAEVVLPATDMMAIALEGTGWSPGIVDDDGSARTFSGEWVSVPALLAEMAEKYDKHIVYHEDTLTVDLVDEPGQDRGVVLAYSKNQTGIEKSSDSTEFFTKLYVYGSDNLTFNEVNIHGSGESALDQLQNGQSFITNFDLFLAQGYSEEEIYNSIVELGDGSPFIRISNLNLGDYVDAEQLLIEGRKQLDTILSKPKVSYSIQFANLSELLAEYVGTSEQIDIGDWVTVLDAELGVDIKVRVTSLRMYPGFPERSSCELSNKDEFFANVMTTAAQYTSQLNQSPAVSELLKGYINTFTTAINSGNGALRWQDGQLTAVELDDSGTPTGYQVRLTPTGVGVSKDYGVTYETAMTGEGVLANKVIADSIHILSVGPDGLVVEPNTCGVRINNTEGIVVQSEDYRFKATIKAQNTMSGAAYGFGLWNGDFDEWGEYTGDSLVFGVNMNGGAYFKGEVIATSGTFTGTVYASAGVFAGIVQATDFQDAEGNSLLNPLGKWKNTMVDLGNIQLDGETGNITMTGDINLTNGHIIWGPESSPIRALYAPSELTTPTQAYSTYPNSGTGWHKVLSSSTDFYASYSYDGGTTWSAALKIQGQDGEDGSSGGVDYEQVNQLLAETFGITSTVIGSASIQSPVIQGGQIYGGAIYAGIGSGAFTAMSGTKLELYAYESTPVIGIGYYSSNYTYPFMLFGVGSDDQGTNKGMIKKFSNGIWIGDNDSVYSDDPAGTGIFINFSNGTINFSGSVAGLRAQFA